jgi:hypothetical protein
MIFIWKIGESHRSSAFHMSRWTFFEKTKAQRNIFRTAEPQETKYKLRLETLENPIVQARSA